MDVNGSGEDIRSGGRRERRSQDERCERLIDAARALFAARGIHNTGMAEIARQSGVLVGQIYRDFASKDDLVAQIVERDLSELLDDGALCAAIAAEDVAGVCGWIAGFIRGDGKPRDGYRLYADIIAASCRDESAATILRVAHARLRDRLRAAMEVVAPGGCRAGLVELVMIASGGVLHRAIAGPTLPDYGATDRLVALVEAEIARAAAGCDAATAPVRG